MLTACFQGHLYPDGGGYVVVLHPDHDQLLYGQPCRLPHCGADGVAHRVGRGPRQADQDQVRDLLLRLHECILPELHHPHLPEAQRLHGVRQAERLHQGQLTGPRQVYIYTYVSKLLENLFDVL